MNEVKQEKKQNIDTTITTIALHDLHSFAGVFGRIWLKQLSILDSDGSEVIS